MRRFLTITSMITVATALTVLAAPSATTLTFSNTVLTRPEGASEPAVSVAVNGTVAVSGLQWLFEPSFFGTHLWTGSFASTPVFQGLLDSQLVQPGKQVFGSGDADIHIGSTGVLHATSLLFFVNPTFIREQLGVSAIRCPGVTSATFTISDCERQIIDTAGADRPWVTSDGQRVYISYHDSGRSTLVHVQRSDDDGRTWRRVGDPIVGQGRATGDATFNNTQGPIVADPSTHNVYVIYTAGEAGIQKATSAQFNNVYVSRSSDFGKSWTAHLVYHAPLFTDLSNVFPALAVDSTSGNLYSVWSDGRNVFFSVSMDQGSTWLAAVQVNRVPAATAVFPWVAAYGGIVDVVYYGTDSSSKDDPNAVWNTYLAQTLDNSATFNQARVSDVPNHIGVICTSGAACPSGTRNLLDLFEVAIESQSNKAAIAYVNDTLTQTASGDPLPQIVYAQQK